MNNSLLSLPQMQVSVNTGENIRSSTVHCAFTYILFFALLANFSGCANNVRGKEDTLSTLGTKVFILNSRKSSNDESTSNARFDIKNLTIPAVNEALPSRAIERFSNLQMESDEDRILTEAERWERAEKNQNSSIAKFQTEEEIKIDYSAIAKQYENLLKSRTNQTENENVLYQLARAYDFSGQHRKSLESLTRLIQGYPYSKRKEEVQFRRGELLFKFNRYNRAEKAYQSVLTNYNSPYYERSLHKYAWCVFKQNNFTKSLKYFYQLLDRKFKGDRSMKDFSRHEIDLVDDTFRVVSQIFSLLNGHVSIREQSSKLGRRNYEYQLYSRLSARYLTQDRFVDAAKTLRAFVDLYPNDAHAPQVSLKIINIFEEVGFTKSLIESKIDFISHYSVGKGFWALHEPSMLAEITPHIKKNLLDLAKHFHSIGQKNNSASDYQSAAGWYREYMAAFPSDPNTVKVNFLLAENLNESKNHTEAAIEYENTAYKYGHHNDATEAAYAAILAHQKQIAGLTGKERTLKRKQAASSAIKFAEIFPNDARSPAVLLKVAEDYLEFKQIELAAITAQKIIAYKTKQSKKLERSALAIIAAAEFSMGHHRKAELLTIKNLKMMSPGAKERGSYIERLAASIYKQGEEARNAGNLELAVSHFLRLGDLAGKSKIRITAEYDAAAALLKMGAWDRAAPLLEKIVRSYPKHRLAANAAVQLALSYEKQKQWGSAADMYKKVANREKDPERRRELLWQTAELYARSGRLNKSISVYKTYITTYNEPLEQSIEARQIIADAYSSLKINKKRKYWLKKIIKANKNGISTERTNYLAAKASLELAEPTYRKYHKVQLIKPLKKNLSMKKKLLKESVRVYTLAANYGVAEITTAAFYKIAEIYNEFSRELFASERPAGLSPDELEQYDLLLEEQAYPFEEKAINVHESNALRVRAGIYNKWVQHSLNSLSSLQPTRYKKNERGELLTAEYN